MKTKKMKTKKHNSNEIALKAAGKARRDMEISLYGKTIHCPIVFKDNRIFSRKIKHKKPFI